MPVRDRKVLALFSDWRKEFAVSMRVRFCRRGDEPSPHLFRIITAKAGGTRAFDFQAKISRLYAWALIIGSCHFWSSGYGQDTTQWTTNHYSVAGATLREIYQSFKKSSAHGLTKWNVDWRFSVRDSGGKWQFNQFNTRTKITILLPKWNAPTNASENVTKEWERYQAALTQHEVGHAQFALATAAEIKKRIKEVREDSSKEGLKKKINDLCWAILEEYKRQEKNYDQNTDYGATQGARLSWKTPAPR